MKKISTKEKIEAYEHAMERLSFHASISGNEAAYKRICYAMIDWIDAQNKLKQATGGEHQEEYARRAAVEFERLKQL